MKQNLAAGMALCKLLPHKLTIAIGFSVLTWEAINLVCKFSMVDIHFVSWRPHAYNDNRML